MGYDTMIDQGNTLVQLVSDIANKMVQVRTNLQCALQTTDTDEYTLTLINTYTIQAEIVQLYADCLKSPLVVNDDKLEQNIAENMQRAIIMLNRIVDAVQPA